MTPGFALAAWQVAGIAVVLAIVGVYTFKTRAAGTWRVEAEAEKARGDRLESRVEEQSAQIVELKTRVDQLEASNKELADLATGRPDFLKLIEQVMALTTAINSLNAARVEQHAQNEMHLERLEGGISRIETAVINGGPSVPRQRRPPRTPPTT